MAAQSSPDVMSPHSVHIFACMQVVYCNRPACRSTTGVRIDHKFWMQAATYHTAQHNAKHNATQHIPPCTQLESPYNTNPRN